MDARKLILAVLLALTSLCACSSGGGSSGRTPPVAIDHVAELRTALAQYPVDDYAIVIGDADGPLLTMEFGNFSVDDEYLIASASKWLSGMVIMSLVEQGAMALDDRPQEYISWWTSDAADPRSRITLEHLLSFTAGFDTGPGENSCVAVAAMTLEQCAREFYDGGLAYEPGSAFFYGPAHLQVAARMAEVASGQRFTDLVDLELASNLGLTHTRFRIPSASNPRASGGGTSSASDYGKILQAILKGTFLAGVIDEMERDRTGPPVVIASEPAGVGNNSVDFRYALGHWRECDKSVWDASCDNRRVASSAGAFGWQPWIDYDQGYYGVLAVFEASVDGSPPGGASVEFSIAVRPQILAALEELRAQR
jgi:CubicO group peptidase (beta-lactamase class C family)